MGETARERFERTQVERATTDAAPTLVQPRPASAGGLSLERLQHARRKAALVERLAALGVPVALGEVPDTAAELEDMERFVAEQEKSAQ
jgi:hypothetical protein